jgi:hypothetical protein
VTFPPVVGRGRPQIADGRLYIVEIAPGVVAQFGSWCAGCPARTNGLFFLIAAFECGDAVVELGKFLIALPLQLDGTVDSSRCLVGGGIAGFDGRLAAASGGAEQQRQCASGGNHFDVHRASFAVAADVVNAKANLDPRATQGACQSTAGE